MHTYRIEQPLPLAPSVLSMLSNQEALTDYESFQWIEHVRRLEPTQKERSQIAAKILGAMVTRW